MSKGGTHTKLTGIKYRRHKWIGTSDNPQVYCPSYARNNWDKLQFSIVSGIMTSAGMQCSHCKKIF